MKHLPRTFSRRARTWCIALGLAAVGPLQADESEEARWDAIRSTLFEGRDIRDGAGVVELDAPYRAEDAAVVPVTVSAHSPQGPERRIERLYLVIDNNPAPVASVFHFPGGVAAADVATRVRINEYTNVRAIAESGDGELFMVKRFVKAAGGCSAPAGKDQEAALRRMGKMKLRFLAPVALGEPVTAQLLISHPNSSGMQMDQLTQLYVPAHYVRRLEITYDGATVLTQEGDISLSENPSVRFTFVPERAGDLVARVEDSKGMHFEHTWRVDAGSR